ncbi:right-handed parallel beta-helix repeat-containing protein [Bacillus sp. CGMCC 1.60114]|uniref:right-handed parallel beta-helix repeat-containing protein n=1 Tax=unclassified Bacillus (in: firmicutes) TaxID=185979 RepID=UPI003628A18B
MANLGDLSDLDLITKLPSNNDVLTYDSTESKWVPKSLTDTSDLSTYVLELNRWNVKNDGTDAVNTSQGINNALVWASQQGYTEVVLPKGTYLIDKNKPIEPQSYLTLNLNGATLKMETNNLMGYAVVSFRKNQVYSRITNGIIQGDKDTHDYSSGGTHEGGRGIELGASDGGNNTRFVSLDNLDILDCTGDAITLNSSFGQISPFPTSLASSFEQGSISTTDGSLINSTTKIRSTLQIDMTQAAIVKYGYFGLYGNGFGGLGSGITCDYYDVIFYNSSNTFISAKINVQFFDEVEVPSGASYAKIVLNQSTVPAPANCLINVRVPSFPQYTYIEKCNLHHCRRQGITVGGAKNVYIRDNDIHHIAGTDPQSGIDIEDGYDLNQYIYIERNNFHDNQKYNIIVVNGKFIYIANNSIMNTISNAYAGIAINGGADRVIVTGNNIRLAKVFLSGDVIFSNNYVYGAQINAQGIYANRSINIFDNVFLNSKMIIDTPFPYVVKVDSCRFFNDVDKLNSLSSLYQWTLEVENEPQTISNCVFEGQDVLYLNYSTAGTFKPGWIFENTIFKNVKNPTLFAGTYTNCFFKDIVLLGAQSSTVNSLELRDCKIISTDINNTLLTVNNFKAFKMINCYIEKPNGTVLNIQNVSDDIVLSGNVIKITNDTLQRAIIILDVAFAGKQAVIQNNNVTSTNLTQVGIDNRTASSTLQIVMKNNMSNNATMMITGKEFLQGNIINGITDPYYQMSSIPTSGYYRLGQEIRNSNPAAGGYIGWVCTLAGYANDQIWIASNYYSKGSRINFGNHVYEALNNGTSYTTRPAFSPISGSTVTDNNITWKEIGPLAVFKTFGSIST